MSKTNIGVAIMAAIAITASWNLNQNKNEIQLSDLALANVEALAHSEMDMGTCASSCIFYPFSKCHVYGGYPNPTYCFYYRA